MPPKKFAFTLLFLACLLTFSAPEAYADTYVIQPNGEPAFILNATTQLSFTCHSTAPCSTTANSVTFGTGANTTTFTFGGAVLNTLVGNVATPLTLGTIQTSVTGTGFTNPTSTFGHASPLGFLNITLTQTSPTNATVFTVPLLHGAGPDGYLLTFGTEITPGGHFFHTSVGSNPPGFNYSRIVFSFPGTINLPAGQTTNLTAQVGAVPEPTTVLLLGTGLAGVAAAARGRRKSRRGMTPE